MKKTRLSIDRLFITKIVVIDIKRSIIGIVGKNTRAQRCVILVHSCYPYIYYRNEKSTLSSEQVVQEFVHGNAAMYFKRVGCRIRKVEPVLARPLKGYQRDSSCFLKLLLESDYDRLSLIRTMKSSPVANVFETNVSLKDRFVADTGLHACQWISVQKTESMKTSTDWIKQSQMGEACISLDYKDVLNNSGVRIIQKPEGVPSECSLLTTMSFSFFMKTTTRENVYPVAMKTRVLSMERQSNMLTNHPITMIAIIIRDGESKENEEIILCTDAGTLSCFSSNPFFTIREFSNVSKIQAERNMILNFLKICSTVDYIVGYKLFDRYSVTSIQYAIRRLIHLGETSILFCRKKPPIHSHTLIQNENGNNQQPKFIQYECQNPFEFTSGIDIFHYVKKKYKNQIPRCAWNFVRNELIHEEEGEGDEEEEEEEWDDCNFRKMTKSYTSSLRCVDKEEGGRRMHTFMETILRGCQHFLTVADSENIVYKTIQRSKVWRMDSDDVWNAGETRIFRQQMLNLIGKMKIENPKDAYYVICLSKNMFMNRFKRAVDAGDFSGGGRIIKPRESLVSASTFGIDFNSHYPSIIIGAQIDYTNIVFLSDDGKKPEILEPHLRGTIGDVNVAIIQRRDTKTLPLVRFLEDLKKRRHSLRNDRENPNFGNKAMEKAIKLSMVATTGSIACVKFPFLFECQVIAEIMRWMGRRVFDQTMHMTENDYSLFVLKNEAAVEILGHKVAWHVGHTQERCLYQRKGEVSYVDVYDFKVVFGHTDGMDIVIIDKTKEEYAILDEQNLRRVGLSLCSKLEKKIVHVHFGFMPTNCGDVMKYKDTLSPSLKVEMLAKKCFYINATSKIVLQYDDTISYKGTYNLDLRNSVLQRQAYSECIVHLFKHDEITEDHVSQLYQQFRRNLFDVIKKYMDGKYNPALLKPLVQYVRATRKMHAAKFDNDLQRKSAIKNVPLILKESQRYPYFEIPMLEEHVGYVIAQNTITSTDVAIVKENIVPGAYVVSTDEYEGEMMKAIQSICDRLYFEEE
ncbi:MAG: DNA polymerase domain-containing protein [Promethearchaeota archaeon]